MYCIKDCPTDMSPLREPLHRHNQVTTPNSLVLGHGVRCRRQTRMRIRYVLFRKALQLHSSEPCLFLLRRVLLLLRRAAGHHSAAEAVAGSGSSRQFGSKDDFSNGERTRKQCHVYEGDSKSVVPTILRGRNRTVRCQTVREPRGAISGQFTTD